MRGEVHCTDRLVRAVRCVPHRQRAEVPVEREDEHDGGVQPAALHAAQQRLVREQRGADEALHVSQQAGGRQEDGVRQEAPQRHPAAAVREQRGHTGRAQGLQAQQHHHHNDNNGPSTKRTVPSVGVFEARTADVPQRGARTAARRAP